MEGNEENGNTPTKTLLSMSPSSRDICILCQQEINNISEKRNLWEKNGNKSPHCLEIEECLDVEISKFTDFQSACRPCLRKNKTLLNSLNDRKQNIANGRKMAKNLFVRKKVKRLSKDFNDATTKKKKLCLENDTTLSPLKSIKLGDEDIIKITISTSKGKTEESHYIKHKWQLKLLKSLLSCNKRNVLNIVADSFPTEWKSFSEKHFLETVEKEAASICSQKTNSSSSFKLNDINELTFIDYEKQEQELLRLAPLLNQIIRKVSINTRSLKRTKIKNEKSLLPTLMTAVNTLLMARNQFMNKCASINSILLRNGKASKRCFERFHSLNLAVSYTTVLKKLSLLGKDFQQPVIDWSHSLKEDTSVIVKKMSLKTISEDSQLEICIDPRKDSIKTEILNNTFFDNGGREPFYGPIINNMSLNDSLSGVSSMASSCDDISELPLQESEEINEISFQLESLDVTQKEKLDYKDELVENIFSEKFSLVGDNLDIKVKRRHMMKDRQNKDFHLFNYIAVQNRIVPPKELIGVKAAFPPSKEIDVIDFLPSLSDEQELTRMTRFLIAQDLMKYKEELQWMAKLTPKHLKHRYWEETKKVSNIQSLGIIEENETSTEGIIKIMQKEHEIIPGHGTANILRTLAVGDLLTVERSQNGQEDVLDSTTPSKRLEGLIPALADFHTYGNFLEVVFHLLYDTQSSADIGTLYQARNFLNARSVPASPMKDINACEELLLKYSEALLLTAFEDMIVRYKINTQCQSSDLDNKINYDNILGTLIENYMLPAIDLTAELNLSCPYCDCKYKRMKCLKSHISNKHKQSFNKELVEESQKDDAVLNYSKHALSLGYLIKSFIYARKTGNGEFLVMLHKYLLLYFKLDHRTKYSYQTLHLLSQINFLLPPCLVHEIIWNRSVNNTGKADGNVELDRELEHRNKYAKNDLRDYQGKVTEKSIKRCSTTYDKVKNIVERFDAVSQVHEESGKHTKPNWNADVLELTQQYKHAKLFVNTAGRYHSKFPGMPQNYLSKLNILCFKKWSSKNFQKFYDMNIYKHRDIFTEDI